MSRIGCQAWQDKPLAPRRLTPSSLRQVSRLHEVPRARDGEALWLRLPKGGEDRFPISSNDPGAVGAGPSDYRLDEGLRRFGGNLGEL